MLSATLSSLVSMTRAEAGHSLSVAQGLNSVEALKHLLRRTQYELWTAFNWPQLEAIDDLAFGARQTIADFPTDIDFDQIRKVEWSDAKSTRWTPVAYGIPLHLIPPAGVADKLASRVELWGTFRDPQTNTSRIRVWPSPQQDGFLRLQYQTKVLPLVDDDDYCTLDAVAISLFAAAEILTRAKADDAQLKTQKAQRHLSKTLANTISDKQKVSTFGANRRLDATGYRSPSRIIV